MSTSTALLVIGAVVLCGLVGLGAVGVVAGRRGIARAMAALGELAASRGWRFVDVGSFTVLYEIHGPGWMVRARRASGAGPRLESGLHTRFSAPGAGRAVLYVGPTPSDPAREVERLLGAPASVRALPVEGLPAGCSAYGDDGAVPDGLVASLAGLSAGPTWEALLHPGGVDVWFRGTVADAALVDALITAGTGLVEIVRG